METNQNVSNDFSLYEGGLLNDSLKKIGFYDSYGKLVVAALCFTWLPLVIISAFEGTLYGGIEIPFFKDIAMQMRLLVALPLLISIKPYIDNNVKSVARYFSGEMMCSPEQQKILTAAFRRAKKITSSALAEIILLLIMIGITISPFRKSLYSMINVGTSWMASGKAGNKVLSFAGYWAVYFSIPVFQFFFLRWIWRYIVWVLLLFRLSISKLDLLPTHADRACGLGIIFLAQSAFNIIFAAGSALLSGQLIIQLIKYPDSFGSIEKQATAYIVICLFLVTFPLFFFIPKLFKTKNEGLLKLGNLGAKLSRKFEHEWTNDLPIEEIKMENPVSPNMINSYSGMYTVLQQLRPLPVTLRDVISMGLMLLFPFLPILFIHFSTSEMLQKIAGFLVK